jgi:two-component system, NtrC family, nitrogen regulation sensor histidine kinase NtrY
MATAGASLGLSEPGFFRRNLTVFAEWAGGDRSIRVLEIASIAAVILIGIFTTTFLSVQSSEAEPVVPAIAASLLIANLLPATVLLVLFGRRMALRRAELVNAGSRKRLHVRLVAIFSLISATPTLLLVIFASLLFQSGVQFWFSGSARGMLENAGQLAEGYQKEKMRDVGDETLTMANDFRNYLNQTSADDPEFLKAYITQVLNRKLSESAIVTIASDGTQNTAAVVSPNEGRKGNWIDPAYLKRLDAGESLIVAIKKERIEAVTLIYEQPRSYLYTNRSESVPTFSLGTKAQSVLKDYRAMERRSRSLQLQFNAALYLVSLLIIGITVWVALIVADRLVRPVTNLVAAAEKIADGDLGARVDETGLREDEVGFLSQSFNRMTERLESQTGTLISANRQLDDRRAFIETVLESVTAGIISLDKNAIVRLANSTAEKLLSGKLDTIVGAKFDKVAPALFELVESGQPRAVLQLGDGPEPLTVAVKVVADGANTVVTFEDISQQLADQRRAAWSDVARRIAHEIKNPLTPIQLAAERLQRRFGKQAGEGGPVFEQLTSTIVRQVGDLRNIVDEFSAFARMPKPTFRNEDLNDIVGHAVFMHEVAHPEIKFIYSHPKTAPKIICDRRQLGQAFTNILKNAVEAILENETADIAENGHVNIDLKQHDNRISVTFRDNGPGLPEKRDRIIEPYVTTRKTGSGLGLAIVNKIVEEHFAEINFGDSDTGGAEITINFFPDVIVQHTELTGPKTGKKDQG